MRSGRERERRVGDGEEREGEERGGQRTEKKRGILERGGQGREEEEINGG